MSGTSGLNTGDFTSVNVAYGIGVGADSNEGTNGQVLVSGGTNQPNRWETQIDATMSKLTRGTDIVMTTTAGSVNFYDGSVETEISSVNTTTGVIGEGDGINITGAGSVGDPKIISTDNDGATISNSGGTNSVIKVPHKLSITKVDDTIVEFDGSANKSIDLDDVVSGVAPIYVGEEGGAGAISLSFSTTTLENIGTNPVELSVKKVPQSLTITQGATSVVYDGGTAKSITLTDDDTTYEANAPITLTAVGGGGTGGNFGLNFDTNTLEVPTIAPDAGKLFVKKVPQSLTITDSAGTSVVYDGSTTKSITINDNDTTYQGSSTIFITGTTDPTIFTIDCLRVPQSLTAGTGITFSSGTTYDGSSAITMSATPVDSENGTCVGVFNPSTEWEFPTSMSITYLSIHDWTKIGGNNFWVEIPASLINQTEYENFRMTLTLYEEDRNAGTGQVLNNGNFMNALLDFVDANGDRIGDIVFFQSGGSRTLGSGNPPFFGTAGYIAQTGGRGYLEISMVLPRPTAYSVAEPEPLRIFPRLNNQSLGGSSLSAFHRLQAGGSNSYNQGSVRKPQWMMVVNPINPSNFNNYTT